MRRRYISKNIQKGFYIKRLIDDLEIIKKAKVVEPNIHRKSFLDLDWLMKTKRLRQLTYSNGELILRANL